MKDFFTDKKLRGNPWLWWLWLFLLLAAIWFILSGIFEIKFIAYGVLSAAVISLFCLRLFIMPGRKTDTHYFLLDVNPFRFLLYFIWLMKEIIMSSLGVLKVILSSKEAIKPQIIWFRADYDNPVARAVLANSITLTPGTITIDIFDDGVYSVQALTEEAAEGMLEGGMQQRIAKVFREEINYEVLDTFTVPVSRQRAQGDKEGKEAAQ